MLLMISNMAQLRLTFSGFMIAGSVSVNASIWLWALPVVACVCGVYSSCLSVYSNLLLTIMPK